MKYRKVIIVNIIYSVLFIRLSCISYPLIIEPEFSAFKNEAGNAPIADSLANGSMTTGMPYYVVEEIFKDWPENLKKTKIPVASLGSRQMLEEIEGWGRIYSDPDIKIFMDEYETEKGTLTIWYQFPDFYRMDISSGDTLLIFLEDTTLSSTIGGLKKARALNIMNSFPQIPRNRNLYSEIHYNDHPWRKISYWYTMNVLSDGQTFILKDLNYQIYPIELLELNNEPVTSFRWK
jgi:hypothetical protein